MSLKKILKNPFHPLKSEVLWGGDVPVSERARVMGKLASGDSPKALQLAKRIHKRCGPVTAEALALPEVSRNSPLAPWKMMIRAIAAFYANDDALCEKYLSAVEPTAAAFRLAPALRAMTGQRAKRTPELLRLAGKVDG